MQPLYMARTKGLNWCDSDDSDALRRGREICNMFDGPERVWMRSPCLTQSADSLPCFSRTTYC